MVTLISPLRQKTCKGWEINGEVQVRLCFGSGAEEGMIKLGYVSIIGVTL